ncbi:MAG: L,D-transpeptidase [Anaerolineae bacterium]|nr:MAG: L,D-transpeptidase [Anaerolineae bacterium]
MSLTRRDFLKLSLLSLSSLAFRPPFGRREAHTAPRLGRVTIREIEVYADPTSDSPIIGKRYRDQVITIYRTIESPHGPAYNPRWHRVWGGYVHSAYVQPVHTRLNEPLPGVATGGQLCEISVPYTEAYTYNTRDGWQHRYRLYYETTHWATDVIEGPDGQPWYEITSELDRYLKYAVPAIHMRPILDEEIAPLSPDVPPEDKRIVVSIARQELTAFEADTVVFKTRISSGLPSPDPIPEGTRTTRGRFNISSKSPSKHMGALQTSGAPGSYTLPGVPWTSFFIPEYGVAFHGTFWHDNFGLPMSHGCVNMRNADAKWLFRWVTPVWEVPRKDPTRWDRRGFGTTVIVE